MNCGTKIQDGASFCSKCGTRVGVMPSPAPVGQPVGSGVSSSAKDVGNVVSGAFHSMGEKLNELAGGSGEVNLKFSDFFADIFKPHTREEMDDMFICGTSKTTPDIREVSTSWPRPWLWSRVMVLLLVVFVGFCLMFEWFGNALAIPGIIFFGAILVPFSLLVFFFETNATRNISIAEMMKMFLIGGIASMLFTLIIGTVFPYTGVSEVVPSLLTGLVEEAAKIAIIMFFMMRTKGRNYILSGLLIGAAVGAGFGAFETAGYAFQSMLSFGYQYGMVTIIVRAVLAIGMHTAWAAVEGAALALCESDHGFDIAQLGNPKFLIFAIMMMVLHGLWDMEIPFLDEPIFFGLFGIKYILLIIVVWVIIAVMLNRGLAQINQLANAQPISPRAFAGSAPYSAAPAAQPQPRPQPVTHSSQYQPDWLERSRQNQAGRHSRSE